jgi:hypothetical protein
MTKGDDASVEKPPVERRTRPERRTEPTLSSALLHIRQALTHGFVGAQESGDEVCLFVRVHGAKLLRKPIAVDRANLYFMKQPGNAN